MRLYISIPISGRPLHEAKHHAESIREVLAAHGHECITPFDVCSDPDKAYNYYMGRDIEAILSEDIQGVVIGNEFGKSKGCMLELAAAKIYDKYIVFEASFPILNLDTLTIKS